MSDNTEKKISNSELSEALVERYQEILRKNHKYQMGDDDFQPTTAEMRIIEAVRIILKDLENEKTSK
jgi:hypothetical protein